MTVALPAWAQDTDAAKEGCFGKTDISVDVRISSCTRLIEGGSLSNPNLANAYYNRGINYRTKGLADQAIADYTKAIEIDPGNASAYVNRGVAYKTKGLADQAIADYTKAIEIDPGSASAYVNRGNAYGTKGLAD